MPESASFSVRKRPNYRRRRTIGALLLLGVAVIVVALLSRSNGGPGSKSNPIPTVAFVSKVNSVSQSKSPDAAAKQANGSALVKVFNDYYQEAFVDPRQWGDGTFPDLRDLFVKEAQASFTKDINSLTIGEARTQLKRVDPTTATMTVTVYYDGKAQPVYAVASTTFVARGTLKETGPPVTISQKGTFYLQKQGRTWTITAFDASQTQNTPTPSPTASAT